MQGWFDRRRLREIFSHPRLGVDPSWSPSEITMAPTSDSPTRDRPLRVYERRADRERGGGKILLVSSCPRCGGALGVDWRARRVSCALCGWTADIAESHLLSRAAELTERAAELISEASLLILGSFPAQLGRLSAARDLAELVSGDLRELSRLREEAESEALADR